VLYDATGGELNRVTFGAQAQACRGRLPDGSATIATFAASASPGASNFVVNYNGPVLNEVLARNQSAVISPFGKFSDFVELRNTSASAANSGNGLGDSAGNVDFVFPTARRFRRMVIWWCGAMIRARLRRRAAGR
jgi:streptogramin lyase